MSKSNGEKVQSATDTAHGDGHKDIAALQKAVDGLTKTVGAVSDTQNRIVRYLQAKDAKDQQNNVIISNKERRDILEKVVDPPDRILPSLSNIPALMAFMIPAMDVIKYNYIPRTQWPKTEDGTRTMGLYDIWERSYYLNSLGKEGKQSIRMANVAETRQEIKPLGIVAE